MRPRNALALSTNQLLNRFGIQVKRDRPMRHPTRLLLLKAREMGAATILDVGANSGQFAIEAFAAGWTGRLVSFEPIRECHGRLSQAASANPRWFVAPPMALGSTTTETSINISRNLVSSSLLQLGTACVDTSRDATAYVRTEAVAVRRLDDVLEPEWNAPYALKLDTQGFELEVLKGATQTLAKTTALMIEISLAPTYEGIPRLGDLVNFVEDAGFRCIALTEGFANYERNEVLQVDGVFVRNEG